MKLADLFESDAAIPPDDMVEAIRRDCQPFLEQTEDCMFRGMNGKPDVAFKRAVRTDRRPMNMSKEKVEAYNRQFKEKFGFNARSETVFTTGSLGDAKSYGSNAYAIFPVGDFQFVWSPIIGDLFMTLDDESGDIEKMGYQDDDLAEAILSEHEIMVHCKEYYAVPVRVYDEARALLKKLKED